MEKSYPFIIRPEKGRLQRANIKRVFFARKTVPSTSIPAFGVTIGRSTGKVDRTRLQIFTTHANIAVDANPKKIREKIRRIRPEEQKQLELYDTEIARLFAERTTFLKTVWEKGHVVTVKELIEQAE